MSDGNNNEQLIECPICLEELFTRQVGTTDTCNHRFCVACLKKWSKYKKTCPVDRKTFNFILVRRHIDDEVLRRISVRPKTKKLQNQGHQLRDVIFCEVCRRPLGEYWTIICDRCGAGYHKDCLDPHQRVMPMEGWLCPNCIGLNPVHRTQDTMARDRNVNTGLNSVSRTQTPQSHRNVKTSWYRCTIL
jgi:hypothetical protein